ncbi:DUF1667 domain-containing protein [Abyssisolibacter fermentans]|uniref:DUF1667 domain-containing protein n=1 Tax=Abyssisolibacter fermentans TaxID=1766203 RepID=UPI00082BBB38|nr:DUF1667 domain-containing protein [Abyssisolibacter fermentans]
MKKEMICITCPMGCHLTVEDDKSSESGYKVSGNICKRGEKYAVEELTNPTRVITSTVKIENGILKRLPVKTDGAIPKDLNFKCMEEINKVVVNAPISVGDVIIENILNTGINLVASRSM